MRRVTAALAAAVLAGCGAETAQEDAAAPAEERTPAGASVVAFLAGGDTIATETYEHEGDRVRGELRDRDSGARAQYVAVLGPDGRVARLEITAFHGGAAEPRAVATLELRGDTLVAEERRGDGPAATERMAVPPGTRIYLNPSMGMLEQLIHADGGAGSLHVLQVSMSEPPRLVQAEIVRSGEEVEVRGDTEVTLRVDGAGRVLSGSAAGGRVRVQRVQ